MLDLARVLSASWDAVRDTIKAIRTILDRKEHLQLRQEALMTRQEHLQTCREAAWAIHRGHDEEIENGPPSKH